MDTAVFETDRMLKLLTEALRRGPGSPEWHTAVRDLRDVATPEADEYRLLIAARERLDAGRAYREVRAGPGFTRELFGRLDATADVPRRLPLGVVVRLVCLLTLVAAIGLLVLWVVQSRPTDASEKLSARLFVTPLRAWDFASAAPKDLRKTGPLTIEVRGGALHAGTHDAALPAAATLVATDTLDLTRGTCLESRIDYHVGPTSVELVLQPAVLATTSATPAANEIALVCDAAGVRLACGGTESAARPLSNGTHLLRLKIEGDTAVAEVDGQTIWAGRQPLGARGFAAVRVRRTARGGDDCAVESLRVLAP